MTSRPEYTPSPPEADFPGRGRFTENYIWVHWVAQINVVYPNHHTIDERVNKQKCDSKNCLFLYLAEMTVISFSNLSDCEVSFLIKI